MDPPSGTIVVMLPENDMELGEPANVDKLTAGTNRETSSIPPSLELCEDTLGVIDLDSPLTSRFDSDDQAGIEKIAALYLAASDRA